MASVRYAEPGQTSDRMPSHEPSNLLSDHFNNQQDLQSKEFYCCDYRNTTNNRTTAYIEFRSRSHATLPAVLHAGETLRLPRFALRLRIPHLRHLPLRPLLFRSHGKSEK
jgi:hypothetical protein